MVKKNLNSIQRDFIVFKILQELLWITKKNVLLLASSKTFNNAFDECTFRYSTLSIKTIFISEEYVVLFRESRGFWECFKNF